MVLDYTSQPTSLSIPGLSVSLLTISLRYKSFVSTGLDLIFSIKHLRISALATPYRPTPVFMPAYTSTKGSYSR